MALAVSVGARALAVESVVVDGLSMAPSFASGGLVAVNKMAYASRRSRAVRRGISQKKDRIGLRNGRSADVAHERRSYRSR